MSAPTPDEKKRWLDRPGSVRKVIIVTLAICAATVLADLFYDKHGHFGFEEVFGFHAFYGFVSCVLLVLAATQLRKLVMRPEDYYDPSDEPEGRVLEDHERGGEAVNHVE